jgi:phenylalanyl-tRNA synthetase beta chain
LAGIGNFKFEKGENENLGECVTASVKGKNILLMGAVNKSQLEKFSIKQPVYFICFDWNNLMALSRKKDITFEPVPKFPQVQRDLAILVNKNLSYGEVEELVKSLHIKKLQSIRLFDVFENKKLGENKKSFAISLTFLDKEKTMTDEEVEALMNKIISNLESKLNAVIRSNG